MSVAIGLLGDVMLGRNVAAALRTRSPEELWDPALRELTSSLDLVICNLECCLSSRGRPTMRLPGKPFSFAARRARCARCQRSRSARQRSPTTSQEEASMKMPPIVSSQQWEAARQQLLVKEKELTRARDALAAERRRMPRMAVQKDYRFEGPHGPASLLDLFDARHQLIVYRLFFEPGVAGWPDRGCGGCSFLADQVAHLAHLNARDTTLAFVSRAPQPDIERWKARMGWEIPWYTITDDFDADFGVDEWHGTNAFFRDDDNPIFRTYFVNNRGDEAMGSTWSYLDLTALGRQEEWEDSPAIYPQTPPYQWSKIHDEYGQTA